MGSRNINVFVRAYNRDAIERVRARVRGVSEAQLIQIAERSQIAVIRRAQPIAKRDIRQRYNVRSSALNDKFRVVEGQSRKRSPYIGVWASSRQVNLIEFNGRWSKRQKAGASAEILVGQRKYYSSAFIANVKGLRGIRVRSLRADGTGKRHGRGPLRMLRGPSPFEMLLGQNMDNGPKVAEQLLAVQQAEMHRLIRVALGKRR